MVNKKSSDKDYKESEQSTQSTGTESIKQTLKQGSKIWKSEREKNGEVKCTYNLFICEEI